MGELEYLHLMPVCLSVCLSFSPCAFSLFISLLFSPPLSFFTTLPFFHFMYLFLPFCFYLSSPSVLASFHLFPSPSLSFFLALSLSLPSSLPLSLSLPSSVSFSLSLSFSLSHRSAASRVGRA